MTRLEHLIENTLYYMPQYNNMSYKDIIQHIQSDSNYDEANITAEQCWEICQYVYYTYCFEMQQALSEYHKIEVIHCKDCKYFMHYECKPARMKRVWCKLGGLAFGEDDYCSCGERK